MKLSNYNIIFDHQGKTLAFNSMTCALAAVNSDFLEVLKEIENKTFDKTEHSKKILDLVKSMKKGGFIIDDCFDELEFLKFKNYSNYCCASNINNRMFFEFCNCE